MEKTIITTVGISLIINWLENKQGVTEEHEYQHNELKVLSFFNERSEKMNTMYVQYINKFKSTLQKYVKRENSCTEISSIIAIEQELKKGLMPNEVLHLTIHLLCPDTILSPLCAELIAEELKDNGYNVAFETEENIINKTLDKDFESEHIIQDLRIDDKEQFEKRGINLLIDTVCDIIDEKGLEHTILNISGGYKGLIPYMTIFSQINHVPIFYIFKDTKDVIKIPQAPVDIDWQFILKHSNCFYEINQGIRLGDNYKDWNDYIQKNNLNGELNDYVCILDLGEQGKFLILNPIGKIIYKDFERYFFAQIPFRCKYFDESITNRQLLNTAFAELHKELSELHEYDPHEKINNDLTHDKVEDTWIYRKASPQQIRVQYKYDKEKNLLTIFNYHFITSQDDEMKHLHWVKDEYEPLKNTEFVKIGFKKR